MQSGLDDSPSFLEVVLTELVYAEALMVRRIVTSYKSPSQLGKELGLSSNTGQKIQEWQVPVAISLRILYKILGGSEATEKALRRLINYERSSEYMQFAGQHEDWLVGMVLPIVGYSQHGFNANINAKPVYRNPENREESWTYAIIKYGHKKSMYYAEIKELNRTAYDNPKQINLHLKFFTLLHQAFIILDKAGYLS